MATPEEHYQVAAGYANQAAQAMGASEAVPTSEVLALAQLQVALGQLAIAIERPGRSLILPNHR
jgi:hypothetical protein